MNYKGKLFGKIGRKTFDTVKTADDWDRLEADSKRLDWLSQADCWFDEPSDGNWTPETWRAAIDEKMREGK